MTTSFSWTSKTSSSAQWCGSCSTSSLLGSLIRVSVAMVRSRKLTRYLISRQLRRQSRRRLQWWKPIIRRKLRQMRQLWTFRGSKALTRSAQRMESVLVSNWGGNIYSFMSRTLSTIRKRTWFCRRWASRRKTRRRARRRRLRRRRKLRRKRRTSKRKKRLTKSK